MEVMIPTPTPAAPVVELNFDSSNSSPYISAPSSPRAFFFFSAPTSPTKSSSVFYKEEFNSWGVGGPPPPQITTDHEQHVSAAAAAAVPFNWEVTPGTPKSMDNFKSTDDDDEEINSSSMDFSFDFSGLLETCSLTADELFDDGKIKPLKPPPRLHLYDDGSNKFKFPAAPKSPPSPKKLIKDVLSHSSPRHKNKDNFDPFAAAHEQTCRQEIESSNLQQRGRERTTSIRGHNKKKTRSLSPFRVSDLLIDQQDTSIHSKTSNGEESSLSFASFWYRNKWKLKDLLLFRSASEGRATSNEDQMKKYGMLKKSRGQEDVKNSSFRSTDSVGSATSSSSSMPGRRMQPPVSAHELHYTANRAVSEEMKKKTFLPYKRSLLGCLGLRSGGMHIHHFSNGFGSLSRPTS